MPHATRLRAFSFSPWILLLPLANLLGGLSASADPCVIEVPASTLTQHIAVELPRDATWDLDAAWQLVNVNRPGEKLPAQVTCSLNENGTLAASGQRVLASIAPTSEGQVRTFRLEKLNPATATTAFRFEQQKGRSLELLEDSKHVLTYNFGTITDPKVPENDARRSRGCYIHPVWGMSGEILTADFPRDHYHHHGIFWSWPFIKIDDETYDLWEYKNIQQRFVKWLHQETGPVAAVVGVENGWFVGEQQVVTERIWITVYRSEKDDRSIDLTLAFEAGDKPVTLQGRQTKSYGGLTVRYDVAPRTDALVRVPGRTLGNIDKGPSPGEDLLNTPLPWADLASQFPHANQRSGGSLFIHPDHPDYPPTWLTRTYGALCVGWPGIKPHTIDPQKSATLGYRFWVHRSEITPEAIDRAYRSYRDGVKAAVRSQ